MKRKRGEIRIDLEYDSWDWNWLPFIRTIPGYYLGWYFHWLGAKIKLRLFC